LTLRGDVIGLWTIYFLCIVIIARSIYVYVRAPKPYVRGLVGSIAMMLVIGLWVIGTTRFPHSMFLPSSMKTTPPIGFLVAVYYLTLTPERNRFLTLFFLFGLIVMVVGYLLSVIYP